MSKTSLEFRREVFTRWDRERLVDHWLLCEAVFRNRWPQELVGYENTSQGNRLARLHARAALENLYLALKETGFYHPAIRVIADALCDNRLSGGPLPSTKDWIEAENALNLQAERPDDVWSTPQSPAEWARVFKCNPRTFTQHVKKGAIRAKKITCKSYQVLLSDVPTLKR